jgi:hypothetical protein
VKINYEYFIRATFLKGRICNVAWFAIVIVFFVPACKDTSETPSSSLERDATSPEACAMGSSYESCGCPEYVFAHPLETVATASVGRYVDRLCLNSQSGQLIATSHPSAEPDGNGYPDNYFRTVFDAASLEVLEETTTDQIGIETDGVISECVPRGDEGFLAGDNWFARVQPHAQEEWWEYLLTVNNLNFSFNRALNIAPATVDNTSFRLENDNTAAARIQSDGTARFYFHAYHGGTIDVLAIDNLPAMTTNPPATDENGFQQPSFRQRVTLFEGEDPFGYTYPALVVAPAADNPAADMVVYFSRGVNGVTEPVIGALRVEKNDEGITEVTQLPPLALDTFWGQSGWHNLGMGADNRLYAQSDVASFSNSQIVAIDVSEFKVDDTWEPGCIDPPLNGSMVIPWTDGQILRFSYPPLDDSASSKMMFIENGIVQAIGNIPFSGEFAPCRILGDESVGLVWTLQQNDGTISAIRIPKSLK